jgi:hypothetical protein
MSENSRNWSDRNSSTSSPGDAGEVHGTVEVPLCLSHAIPKLHEIHDTPVQMYF